MWRVLLAAAVAGSGILVKKLIVKPNDPQPSSDSRQNDQNFYELNDPRSFNAPFLPKDSIFKGNRGFPENHSEAPSEVVGDGSIFMFSSTSGSEIGPKNWRKGNAEGFKRKNKGKGVKKCGVEGCEKQGWVMVDHRKGGKRLAFCLKKRRTSKNVTGKCRSCASKGNSFFTWGLSVGMMYMMSAGKAEVNRLYSSVDETARIVQELKAELSRRKTLQNKYASNFGAEVQMKQNRIGVIDAQTAIPMSNSQKTDAPTISGLPLADEVECSSSVLTEEQQLEVLEMDQLEAELESELQKLPWSCKEFFGFEGSADVSETGTSAREFCPCPADDRSMISHQPNGVPPSELEQKLSQVLIEQQESHIAELEAKLQRSHSKLYEKEAELQALKDCVRRLTEFSLGGDDTEFEMEDEKTSVVDGEISMVPQSTNSVVGLKRGHGL